VIVTNIFVRSKQSMATVTIITTSQVTSSMQSSLQYRCHRYLFTDLLRYHEPTRALRSSSSHQLSIPRHNLTFKSRAFRFSAPRVSSHFPLSDVIQRHTIFSRPVLIELSILPRIFPARALILLKTLVL